MRGNGNANATKADAIAIKGKRLFLKKQGREKITSLFFLYSD